ncbi:MAG: 5'-nucleotidase C-terminal domain-containing protein [Roseovarius pacificus]|nr:5'-nucleotidase C-terminal domain-containing protein [Roseovarius pacificus]
MTRTDPMLQLINRAKARALEQAVRGTADEGLPVLSATAPFKTGGRAGPQYYTDVPAGPLRLRHAADLYSFPNTLVGARIDGARLRDWLERAASCFRLIVPDRADQMLCNSLMPGHAFDVIDGIRYRIDLTQPPRYAPDGSIANPGASRIVDLEHDGVPVTDSDRFLIATNSYRAFGGGSYPALPEPDIVLQGETPVRDILRGLHPQGRAGDGPRHAHMVLCPGARRQRPAPDRPRPARLSAGNRRSGGHRSGRHRNRLHAPAPAARAVGSGPLANPAQHP